MSEQAPEPVVSVVIVSWNARDYLVKCLDTLNERSCRYPLEVIVVDNDSADDSPDVVERDYSWVRLIRTGANLGFAKGNNVGIKEARGRYVALVNSDVEVLESCLTKLVDYLDKQPEAGMAGPRVIGGDGKLQRSCRGFPGLWNMFCRALALDAAFPSVPAFNGYALAHWEQEDEAEVDILSGCFWMVRREALDEVGGLDEGFFMYGEDMDWCKRFWDAGWKLKFYPEAEAIHYGGASSSNAPVRFFVEKQRADLRYWRKHRGPVAVVLYFLISLLSHLLRMAGYAVKFGLKGSDRETSAYKVRRSMACVRWMFSGQVPA